MIDKANQLNPVAKYQNDMYYKKLYGKHAIVTRLGYITIIHLDRPNKEKIKKRKEEIMREEITDRAFFDDCPLCQEFQRHPHDIVYYKQD